MKQFICLLFISFIFMPSVMAHCGTCGTGEKKHSCTSCESKGDHKCDKCGEKECEKKCEKEDEECKKKCSEEQEKKDVKDEEQPAKKEEVKKKDIDLYEALEQGAVSDGVNRENIAS